MTLDPNRLGIGLGVMARAPELGKVKTRLAADIGPEAALAVYEELLLRVERDIAERTDAAETTRITAALFVEPADAVDRMRALYPRFDDVLPQSGGALGERMTAALSELLRTNEKAMLIGADVPDLNLDHIVNAAAALEGADVVFAPAPDGGYSLIGVTRIHPVLFNDIPWSSPKTLSLTLDACRAAGLSYALIDSLSDLDTVSDFSHIRWRPANPDLQRLLDTAAQKKTGE